MPRLTTNANLVLFMAWSATASMALSAFLFWSGAYHQSFENMYDLFLLCLNCP
jgi:hypothetical protein